MTTAASDAHGELSRFLASADLVVAAVAMAVAG